MQIEISTRKTKQGYYQPILICDGQKYTPNDWSEPSITRKHALNHAEWWKLESKQVGYILNLG